MYDMKNSAYTIFEYDEHKGQTHIKVSYDWGPGRTELSRAVMELLAAQGATGLFTTSSALGFEMPGTVDEVKAKFAQILKSQIGKFDGGVTQQDIAQIMLEKNTVSKQEVTRVINSL